MMMLLFSAVLALASAQPESGETKCKLEGDLAILLDPAVDKETFELLKRAAMDAALSFDLSKSRMGIWQMCHPPILELAMGPTNQEDLIKKFMEIVQVDSASHAQGAEEAMKVAAKSLAATQGDSAKDRAILYVAATPKDESLLRAAEDVRAQGIVIRAIAVGMTKQDVEDLFAMTGADSRVLQLSKDAQDTSARVSEFVCKKSSDIGPQDGCFGICW